MASAASCTKTSASDRKMAQLCAGPSVGTKGGAHWAEFTYVYANTYATGGGDPCDLTSTFPSEVMFAVLPPLDDTRTVMPLFNKTTKKMLAYTQKSDDTFTELGAVDAHTYTFKFWAFGF